MLPLPFMLPAMWETWQRDDDDVVRAAISASKVLDLWPIPKEAREETLLRLTEAIFDMITELREYEA
jgi:hypothetical protein